MLGRSIRTSQPQSAAAWPAPSGGVGSGPSFAFSAGAGLHDLAGGHLATVGGSLVRRPTPFGMGVNAGGAAGYQLQYPTARPLDGASSITVEFLVIPSALAGKPLAQWAGADNVWLTQIDTDGSFIVGVSTGQSGSLDARRSAPGHVKTGELCHFFWTWAGGDVNANSVSYVKGRVVTTKNEWGPVVTSGTFAAIPNSERTPISIGGSVESASGFNGMVLLARTYRRVLSHAEVIARTQNPYMDSLPDNKAIWTPSAASVSLPTLVQPNATTSMGAWFSNVEASPYEFLSISEVIPNDDDYIQVNSASTCEFVLAEAAFPGTANQTLAYRASSTQGSTLTVTLKQGATIIMTRTHALTAIDTLYTQTLTAPEIALITAGAISVTLTTS